MESERGAQRIRVAHLAARLPVGGMENVVASLVRGMPADRYESAIWCLEEADRLGCELRAGGTKVVELGRRRRRDLGLFWRVAALARASRIDILHCHDELSWFYGTIGASLAGVPRIIMTVHGRRAQIAKRHLREQRLLAWRTATIVCVSACLRQQLLDQLGVAATKVVAIPNGIPLPPCGSSAAAAQARAALGVPQGALVVGCVGELSPVKNFDLAIEAVAVARALVPGLRLVLIGDGPCRPQLAQKVSALGLQEVVQFAGLRRDVETLWAGFDIYLCSSNYEGLSLSILEAMAAGRAVVATAVGGNPELVHPNETGVLVPSGDKTAMAGALVSLARDPAKRRSVGFRAQVLARRAYARETMIGNYDCLYRTALQQGRTDVLEGASTRVPWWA